MKDSGTYTFKKDDLFQQAAELTKPKEVPTLIISGPPAEVKVLLNLIEEKLTDVEMLKLNVPETELILFGWRTACEHAINDETLNQQ